MSDNCHRACRMIIQELLKGDMRKSCDYVKFRVCKEYGLKKILTNADILASATEKERERILPILQTKPVRSISGVNVVAVMTKPSDCPHGKCAYCPGGTKYDVPSSYTGREPATMRGIQNKFNPYQQVKCRIDQLKTIGHSVDKVELIIMGGTFTAMSLNYQEDFVKGCLNAITGLPSRDLEEAKRQSEESTIRNVGITFETRPDYAREKNVDEMLRMGVTRVEIGVQTVYDDIYQLVGRGHTINDVIEATRIIKDAGLKICYHIMPNLPGSSYDRDIEMFKILFQDSRFKPDELKIYPTLVLEGTRLYEMWRIGKYQHLTNDELVRMLVKVKSDYIPGYVRIKRIMRDIPSTMVVAGPKVSNLREVLWQNLQRQGKRCKCIRCHEVGHVKTKLGWEVDLDDVRICREDYEASEGREVFLSFKEAAREINIGFLRLRIPSEQAHRKEVKDNHSVLVRELHVYGPLAVLREKPSQGKWQHRGYGRKLLEEAERISIQDFDARRILVTSGLGVKEYYRKLGYESEGPYMVKNLT